MSFFSLKAPTSCFVPCSVLLIPFKGCSPVILPTSLRHF